MATQYDYAALSALVYNNVRGPLNLLSTPTGWKLLPVSSSISGAITSAITGFTAAAYRNTATNEIVIAYKGTDTVNAVQTAQDFLFGNAAALGGSVQLVQAALFYEQVKAQYGSNITFAGHSLGGGLASVMSAWFGKSATTFAQAPFEIAAVNPFAIAAVQAALSLNLYLDTDFLLFNPLDYASRQSAKGVSFALLLEKPCHVAHALNWPEYRNILCSAESTESPAFSPMRIITVIFTGYKKRLPIGTVPSMRMYS